MAHIKINFDEPAWPDLPPDTPHGEIVGITMLEGGMQSGAPSVSLRIKFPDGTEYTGETSYALFRSVSDALKGRRAFIDGHTADA